MATLFSTQDIIKILPEENNKKKRKKERTERRKEKDLWFKWLRRQAGASKDSFLFS